MISASRQVITEVRKLWKDDAQRFNQDFRTVFQLLQPKSGKGAVNLTNAMAISLRQKLEQFRDIKEVVGRLVMTNGRVERQQLEFKAMLIMKVAELRLLWIEEKMKQF